MTGPFTGYLHPYYTYTSLVPLTSKETSHVICVIGIEITSKETGHVICAIGVYIPSKETSHVIYVLGM
jgi:hypothetical protein